MGRFLIKNQKSVLFHASTASNLIRNLKLHIIFSPETLKSNTHSLNLEIYGRFFNRISKKHITSHLRDRQFDTQSKIAYYFPARDPHN